MLQRLECCPNCGQPARANPERITVDQLTAMAVYRGQSIQLSKLEARALGALARAYPNGQTDAQLVEAMYGDRPDGGPVTTVHRVLIVRIRRRLANAGWPFHIVCRYSLGYWLQFNGGQS